MIERIESRGSELRKFIIRKSDGVRDFDRIKEKIELGRKTTVCLKTIHT